MARFPTPDDRLRPGEVGLPPRPFLYSLDQISTLLCIERSGLSSHIHFEGRSVGPCRPQRMLARDIAPPGERPDWRVAESELVRWCRLKGFRLYERGWARY